MRPITPPTLLAVVLTILLGLIPLGVYAVFLGAVPTLQAAQALELLVRQDQKTLLLDVRSEQAYQERHIDGAAWMPLDRINEMKAARDIPSDLQAKTFLLVCDAGFLSAQATRHLRSLGLNAYTVRGGMQDWGRAWPEFQEASFSQFRLKGGVVQEPFRMMPQAQQAAAALALLWVKPVYMLLSTVLAWLLLRQRAGDLRILGWGLLAFLTGEVYCAINYIFLKDNSYLSEYLHSYSMVVAFGLAAYALLEGLDGRVVHFTQADKRCAMLPVCGPCVKYQPVRCGIRRIAQLSGLTVILLSFIPILSKYNYTAYNTFIGPFSHYYVRPFVHQWFEARYAPLAAIILTGLAMLVLQLTPKTTLHPLARVLFCAGAGFFGFSLFRVGLGLVFAEELVWAIVWEEWTELMFVAAVVYILWVFQRTLLPDGNLFEALKKAFSFSTGTGH